MEIIILKLSHILVNSMLISVEELPDSGIKKRDAETVRS